MRLGLLIYGSLETRSGGYLYDRELVAHLRRQGDRVEIISLPWRNYARHLGDNFAAGLLRRLERAPFDLLLQDELNHPSMFLLNRGLRRRVGYPLVTIVHHLRSSEARPAWQNLFYAWVEARYLAGMDALIANSRTTLRAAIAHLAWTGRARRLPALVAYPAGDRLQANITPDEIARRAGEPGPLRMVFIGNLIPRKGLHTLLAALQRLPAGLCNLEVIGSPQVDPAYAQAVQRQAQAPELVGQVTFCGPLPDPELAARLRGSHLLVVPSSYEGFGIAYLEGMGLGLPAIAGQAGGAAEIITPGLDGYLIRPGDAAGLAGQIAALAHDRDHLLRLSLAARQRYTRHPGWDESAAQIRRFLERLLNENDT